MQELSKKVDILHGIDLIVQEFIKNEQLPRLTVVNLRQNILVVATHSAATAHRLKIHVPNLLAFLRQKGFPQIMSIDLKIDPNSLNTKKPS